MRNILLIIIVVININAFELEFSKPLQKISAPGKPAKLKQTKNKSKTIKTNKGSIQQKLYVPRHRVYSVISLTNDLRYNPYKESQELEKGLNSTTQNNQYLYQFIDLSNPTKIKHIIYK